MTSRQANTSTRRRREFTREETLARHPIMLLFDMPQVQTVLSWRREAGLHFRDLQFLLCKDPPTGGLPEEPEECQRKAICLECRRFRRCVRERSVVWLNQISRSLRQQMRIYRNKANLAGDLGRLCSVGYLKKRARGYYERDKEIHQIGMKGLLRRSLRQLVTNCPESMILVDEDAVFLYMSEGAIAGLAEDSKTFKPHINHIAQQLAQVRLNDVLHEVSRAFEKELLKIADDKKRVYLWRYLCNHIMTRLASFGVSEHSHFDGARRIFDADLGIEKTKLREVMREFEKDDSVLREAKRRMSKAMWLDAGARTDEEKYGLLTTEYSFSLDPECKESLREGRPSSKLRVAWKGRSKPLTSRANILHPATRTWIVCDGATEFEIRDSGRWLRVYSKKPDEKQDLSEVELVRRLLNEEEKFREWFERSQMSMPLDLLRGGPILLIGVLGP